MIWIIGIIILAGLFFLSRKKDNGVVPEPVPGPPEPPPKPLPPGPHYYMWQMPDKESETWKQYCEDMKNIITDTLVATVMRLLKWVSDPELWNKVDHWATSDIVWKNKKDDCDGLARLSADLLGRFCKYTKVYWLEYYGYYRKYYHNQETDKWGYDIVLGGHAITIYIKNDEILAFSNTNWWYNKNFQDYVEVGEETFPEGLVCIICRHWESGLMHWVLESEAGEILKGSNVFDRDSIKIIDVLGGG